MGRRLRASDSTKATRHKASEVVVRNIAHPKVWATAIRLAAGDKAKVVVESYTRVSVIMP